MLQPLKSTQVRLHLHGSIVNEVKNDGFENVQERGDLAFKLPSFVCAIPRTEDIASFFDVVHIGKNPVT
jgi:hypothetical protein